MASHLASCAGRVTRQGDAGALAGVVAACTLQAGLKDEAGNAHDVPWIKGDRF